MATAPRTTVDSLQAGRGLAAMAVVCHHVDTYVSQQVGALPRGLSTAMSFGYLGVDFFFVLSGFIIYFTNAHKVDRPGWPRAYAASRFTRIYLPYLPVGIALALGYTFLPNLRRGEIEWNWFSTLTLLPSNAEPSLHVAWTLQHEIIFYAIAFVLLRRRKVLLGSLLWATLVLALLPLKLMLEPGVSPIDLEFLFGICIAWCFLEGKLRAPLVLASAGVALLLLFLAIGDRYYSVMFGLGLALILLPVIRFEASGRLHVARPWILLGDASYAIYLVHLPVLSVAMRLFGGMPPLAAAAISILLCAVAGIAYHKLFEKPALKQVRAWLSPRAGQRPPA